MQNAHPHPLGSGDVRPTLAKVSSMGYQDLFRQLADCSCSSSISSARNRAAHAPNATRAKLCLPLRGLAEAEPVRKTSLRPAMEEGKIKLMRLGLKESDVPSLAQGASVTV